MYILYIFIHTHTHTHTHTNAFLHVCVWVIGKWWTWFHLNVSTVSSNTVKPLSYGSRPSRITRHVKLELHKYSNDTFSNNFGWIILDYRERARALEG